MKCELSILQKLILYGSTLFYAILSTSVFIIVGDITLISITSVLIAVLLIIYICKICYYIEILDDKHIIAKNIIRTYAFTRVEILNIHKYRMASIILIKYKHGSIILLMKMKNIDALLSTI